MKVFFLKDSEIGDWLVDGFKSAPVNIEFVETKNSPKTIRYNRLFRILVLHSNYLLSALRACIKSQDGDRIICFLDVHALYVFLVSKLLGRKIVLIPLNIMVNDYHDFFTRLKKQAFCVMLHHPWVYPTITSKWLEDKYRKLFNLPDKNFLLLNDCYGKLASYESAYVPGNGTVFCGGTNGRDWNLLVEVAGNLPQLQFVVVGPKPFTLGANVPPNITYHCNIPFARFQELIRDCSVVALPLNTTAPAGLIVLYTAGLMRKAVVTTRNVSIDEYITSGVHALLVPIGDVDGFAANIERFCADEDCRAGTGESLYQVVKEKGSIEQYVSRLVEIVQQTVVAEKDKGILQ